MRGLRAELFSRHKKFAQENNIEFSGRIITPGWTSGSAVSNALGFIKENYTKGEKVIIYGYSYGGDFAVELADALTKEGIAVDLLITIDAADGTGPNLSVNDVIPEKDTIELLILKLNCLRILLNGTKIPLILKENENREYITCQYQELNFGLLGGLKIEGLERIKFPLFSDTPTW